MHRELFTFLMAMLWIPADAEVKREDRGSLLNNDPEVVYLEETVKKPIVLSVVKEAPVYTDREGKHRVGFIKANQQVELLAMTEKVYRVRGEGVGNNVVGWVGPWAFESKDPDFVENLKKLYERQIEVQALIAANQVAIGMTLDEVNASLGKPVKTSSRKTANGLSGQWQYIEYEDVKHYITRIDPVTRIAYRQLSHVTREEKGKTVIEYENNLVTAIEESEQEKGGNVKIIVPPLFFRW